eukprot:Hpha_TRINITY_DN1773_c0_g1::TRINITY_DN1773_c0_g1_i2::g.158595::m.158595
MRRAVAAILLPAAVLAWGPLSHYSFACGELGAANLETCIDSHPDLITGDDFPDAFVFGDFVEGSNCSGDLGAYHNNAFATLMLLRAPNWTSSRSPAGGRVFNATAFALGYASHMYSDDVGFFSAGPLPPRSGYLDWLKTWVYMEAIDSHTAASQGLLGLTIPELPTEGAEFVADSAAIFRKTISAAAPPVTAQQVEYCAKAWKQVLKDKTDEALNALTATWEHQIVYFSPYGPRTWQEAASDLDLARDCVRQVWRYYLSKVRAPGAEPGVVDADVAKYIASLYAAGKCAPAPRADLGNYTGGLLGQFPEAG